MGADLSAELGSEPNLDVALERESYRAGELVRGYVCIQTLGQVRVRSLSVELIGQCQTLVEYRKEGKNAGIAAAQEAKDFLQTRAEVATFPDDKVPAGGTYQCPFQLQLPEWVPASLVHVQKFPCLKNGHSASIFYFVGVRCSVPGRDNDVLVHGIPIDVMRKPLDLPVPASMTDDVTISSWACLGGGAVSLSLSTDRTTFRDDETISAVLAVSGRRAIDAVDVSLVRRTRWSAKGMEVSKTSNEFVERFPCAGTTGGGGHVRLDVAAQLREGLPASVQVGSLHVSYELTLQLPRRSSKRSARSQEKPCLSLPVSLTRSAPIPPETLLEGWRGGGYHLSNARWQPAIPFRPDPALSVERLIVPGVLGRVLVSG